VELVDQIGSLEVLQHVWHATDHQEGRPSFLQIIGFG